MDELLKLAEKAQKNGTAQPVSRVFSNTEKQRLKGSSK